MALGRWVKGLLQTRAFSRCASHNDILTDWEPQQMNNDLSAQLYNAADAGDLEKIEKLMALGGDANWRDAFGTTALMCAAYEGNIKVCKALLKNGADPNSTHLNGSTALFYALESESEDWQTSDLCELLLQYGASVNIADINGLTPLMKSVMLEKKRAFQSLVYDHMADVNAKDQKGRTALMKAACKGNIDSCQLLLSRHADVNAIDDNGGTALMEAACREDMKLCKLFIHSGADVNVQAYQAHKGLTALIIASLTNNGGICRLLISNGARVDLVNSFGETAEQIAKRMGNKEALSALRSVPQISKIALEESNNPTKRSGTISKLFIAFSLLYGFACLNMLISGGSYILFEIVAIAIGFIIWRGGGQKRSFWSVWLISTFVPLLLLVFGPTGMMLSFVARFIIIRLIR